MAKRDVEIVYDEGAIDEFLNNNPQLLQLMRDTAQGVADEAQATASSAENGSGGRIDGYASAGFSVVEETRGGRPRWNVVSNADGQTALAAHFYTQWRDGVAHLRAALYRYTNRG